MPRKRVTTPPPKEATRDTPPTPQQRTECGAAQNMPREPEEASDDAFDLFSEDMDDNISLCSTETIAVWPEIRSSSPEMYDELGWPDTDDFGSRTDGGCCCDSCCGGTRNSGLTSSFPGSPRAQTPVFPMSSKKQATTAAKPKKGLQNVVRQREERTASFESHCCCETARVQEAPAPKRPVHCTKQGSSAAVSTVGSTASRHLTAESLGSAREQALQAALRRRHSLAQGQRLSLLRLWQQIGARQPGNESFHHTFCTYSWSWNAGRELVTVADLRGLDRELRQGGSLGGGRRDGQQAKAAPGGQRPPDSAGPRRARPPAAE
ncbi:EF-hand calcium-binding domain-containing protein 3 isoform X2 [Columba livia]|uniref:EF-hand calcium-binding domain-containing protein 3 isoform X2 n=1 Tax=Columba livia TaxID=8932 RepID=UPI0031BA6084